MTENEVLRQSARADNAATSHAALDQRARRLDRLTDRLPGRRVRSAVRWLRRPSARPVRIVAGPLLIVGGFLSALPLLGFWMLPLGLILLSEDVPPLRRATDRMLDWVERRRPHWLGAKAPPEP